MTEPLLSRQEAADFLADLFGEHAAPTYKTLTKFATTGGGPAYVKIGSGKVGYRRPDLILWMKERMRVVTSSADRGVALVEDEAL
jgi:hypothetical protein